MADALSWTVEHLAGSAGDLHAREPAPDGHRRVWVHEPTGPAVVLGSTQDPGVVDRARATAAGVEVVRRGSGGGAVLVEPGGLMWVDVVVPPADPLWDDDVGRAAHWVGKAWTVALHRCGVDHGIAHEGGLVHGPWSRLVCFGGLGPGEVTVAGRKVVGLAQRRTRHGARFQCAAVVAWDPVPLLGLLRLSDEERAAAGADLARRAAPIGCQPDALLAAFLATLPT